MEKTGIHYSKRFLPIAVLLMVLAIPSQVAARSPRIYLNIVRLLDKEIAQVEKSTGRPTHIDRSNDDVGGQLRDYSLSFGKVKISYFEGKATSFNITLKSPEHSAVAVARRFGIDVSRMKAEHNEKHSKMWHGGFANRTINTVQVAASHGTAWDSITIRGYSSNE